jgi:hypothetical protein
MKTDVMGSDLHAKFAEARAAYANWLDDIIAGLLINGVPKEDIEIERHPDLSTVVVVRGVPRYKFNLVTCDEVDL